MRAVNLIPTTERGDGVSLGLGRLSPLTIALIGGLLTAMLLVTAVVVMSRTTQDRRDQVAQLQAQAAAVRRQAELVAPDLAALQARQRSIAVVDTLAGQRYDWSHLLGAVSRSIPKDAKLTTFVGKLGASSTSGAASSTTTAPTAAGSVALTGCASALHSISNLMDRARRIRDVLDVSFGGSAKSGGSGSGGCPYSRTFNLTLSLTGSTAGAAR